MTCDAMREMPTNKGLHSFHRTVARIWKLPRKVHFELLIIGSQVRALVRPPFKPFKQQDKMQRRVFPRWGTFGPGHNWGTYAIPLRSG
jgi:hypothetical protein